MNERHHRPLKIIATVLAVAWVAWTAYDAMRETDPATRELAAAARLLEDGHYDEALEAFREARAAHPENLGALRGEAQALLQAGTREERLSADLERREERAGATAARRRALDRYRAALAAYDEAIGREEARGITDRNRRIQGVSLANRGIVRDLLGDHRGALADYEAAMRLEPEVGEGPGFLTRFMRNQGERPPSVADRARYLSEQLARPPAERLLRVPEEDASQRAHPL